MSRVTSTTFRPGDDLVGLALRVKAVYQDSNGVLEEVFSTPTAPVANVNDAPTGAPTLSDTTPTEGRALTVDTNTIVDSGRHHHGGYCWHLHLSVAAVGRWRGLDGYCWRHGPVVRADPGASRTDAACSRDIH